MIKEKMIEKYLLASDLEAGYVSTKNPTFNEKYWKELKTNKEKLYSSLQKIGVSNEEIEEQKNKLKNEGEILENF